MVFLIPGLFNRIFLETGILAFKRESQSAAGKFPAIHLIHFRFSSAEAEMS